MAVHHYLIPAVLAAAVLAGWVWAPQQTASADTARPTQATSPPEFTRQVEAMRRMHALVTSARSTEQRQALLDDSRRILSAGMVLMRTMRSGLPTTSAGELVSDVVTDMPSQRVRDFLHLMELLVQMRSDQESVPQAEPTPALDSRSPRPHLAAAVPETVGG